jgi:hypothetical protein
VRHIVYEVIFYLGQFLLTENDGNSKYEGYEQYHRKDE